MVFEFNGPVEEHDLMRRARHTVAEELPVRLEIEAYDQRTTAVKVYPRESIWDFYPWEVLSEWWIDG